MMEFPLSDLQGQIEKVGFGKNRLFLEKAPAFNANGLFGKPYENPEFFARHCDPALIRLKRLCRDIGSQLIVLVAPDAHAVHPEDLPDHLVYHAPSIGEAFVAHLRQNLGIEAFYPRDTLMAASSGPVDVYRRNDTHWSSYGAYIGYRMIVERLLATWPADNPRKPALIEPEDFTYDSRPMLGDLGWASDPPFTTQKLLANVRNRRVRHVSRRSNELRQVIDTYETGDASLPRCVILRDSFATEMGPFLSESFSRITYIGASGRIFPELIRAERPDVVIVERGERALPAGFKDWDFLTYREVTPHIANRDAEKLHNEAKTLFTAGKYAEAAQRVQSALEIDQSPDLYFTQARIYMATKSFEAAEAAFQSAIGGDSGRFAFRLFLGLAQLSQNKYAEALASFAHAVVLAPHHPLGHEYFGYVSMLTGDASGAEIALRNAIELWPDKASTHFWLSAALQNGGKLDEALATMRHVLQLEPDNQVYVDRTAMLEERLAPAP